MRYEALKNNPQKCLQLPLLDKCGIIGKNIFKKEDAFKSRPALCGETESLIGGNIPSYAEILDYRLTDTHIYIEGKYHRIATVSAIDSGSAYFEYVYLIDEEHNVREIGSMFFARFDASTFYIPENITFYVGKKTNGGGIYALVTTVNMRDFESREYNIYEISEDFTTWEKSYNYYVPTVYINGRGTSYDLAKKLDIAVSAAPVELETLNMLDGRFYAYYSSDSYSSSFRLPFSQLSSEVVKCRVYVDSKNFTEWMIASDTNEETLDFYGTKVTLKLDREKGVITFFSGGEEYSLAQMSAYKENNIRVFAKKEIPEAFKKVVSCKHSISFDSKNVFSGGLVGNEVYYSRFDNPLYFPLTLDNQVGSPMSEITALAGLENKIIAFKKTQVYELQPESSKPFNTTNLLIDNPAVFYSAEGFKVKTLSDTVGCANKHSIAKLNGHLIWQNLGGGFSAYSGGDVYTLEDNIKAYIKEWDQERIPYAVAFESYYMLCCDSSSVIMNFKDQKENEWYIWEFPQCCSICGAFSHNNKPIFLCADSINRIRYLASLNGYNDKVLSLENGGIKQNQFNIKAEIKTPEFKICELGKTVKIAKLYIRLEAKGDTDIKISSGENFCDFKLSASDFCCGELKSVRLSPNLKCNGSIYLTFKSQKPLKIYEAAVYFAEMNS